MGRDGLKYVDWQQQKQNELHTDMTDSNEILSIYCRLHSDDVWRNIIM